MVVSTGTGAQALPGVVSAEQAVERSCFAAPAPGSPGIHTTSLTASETGILQARLSGGGDWDLAVFDATSGRAVAASAGFTSNELAEGFVTKGQRLVVQTCRYAGGAASAALTTQVLATSGAAGGETSALLTVATASRADKQRLQRLGLDLTEHGTDTSVDVVAYGERDLQKLRDAGFGYTVVIPDLAARARADRADDAQFAAAAARSDLPSGRTGYRRLADYELEMKQLARRYPGLVKPLTLRYRTVEGRDVSGIEITRRADQVADGKPSLLMMGLHHAREWPSGEHALEFAYDLLTNYRTSERTRSLVDAARTIVVPVINPDGFTISREAPELGDFSLFDYEMKRKNCSTAAAPRAYAGGTCANNPAGRLRGTDLNRNYAGYWGGPGASTNWADDTFRGEAPFGAPETRNVQDLVSSRQVTNLITNHTYSNLVLRPPGAYDTQLPKDEPVYRALGKRMTEHNGYANQLSYNLYETTGSTEDWSYWNTGGLGFTYEIGDESFHPAFRNAVVAEYLGRAPAAGAGKGGNRAAFYEMLESTVDPALHSTLTGTAPDGWTLRVHKEFSTPTSRVLQPDGTTRAPLHYRDVLDSTYRSDGGTFSWAVNPSTRPYVDDRLGRDADGPPQAALTLRNPAGIPAENQGDPLSGPHEEIPFTVQGPPRVDNGRLDVRVEWGSTDTDWDLYVLNEAGQIVTASAAGGTDFEQAALLDPPAGRYTAVLVNYEGGRADDWGDGSVRFRSPLPAVNGTTESWVLTCERPNGVVAAVKRVEVARGETARLGDVCKVKG
ncbi:MAG TPA: M14 family metallopeptidase [Mycobacteriales bacterium]|jgi:hypothetical protein|nr:M14 family metallopeptidase [Mycobacteriales bacterium]